MSEVSFEPMSGGCRCGAVRFALRAAPIITHCCHCRDCQKLSGTAFRINLMVEREHLDVSHGGPVTVDSHGGREVRCPVCSHALWAYHRLYGEAIAFVAVGLLDAGERLPPEAHFFTRSKHPWVQLPPGVPAFETLGDPAKRGTRERLERALARAGVVAETAPS
jgi:hypothetical protein